MNVHFSRQWKTYSTILQMPALAYSHFWGLQEPFGTGTFGSFALLFTPSRNRTMFSRFPPSLQKRSIHLQCYQVMIQDKSRRWYVYIVGQQNFLSTKKRPRLELNYHHQLNHRSFVQRNNVLLIAVIIARSQRECCHCQCLGRQPDYMNEIFL